MPNYNLVILRFEIVVALLCKTRKQQNRFRFVSCNIAPVKTTAAGIWWRLTHALLVLQAAPECGNSSPRSLPTTFAATCNRTYLPALSIDIPPRRVFFRAGFAGPNGVFTVTGSRKTINCDVVRISFPGKEQRRESDYALRAVPERRFCSREHLYISVLYLRFSSR